MTSTPSPLRERIRQQLALANPARQDDGGDHVLAGLTRPALPDALPRPAAVLVPLVEHAERTTIVLTRRTDHLSHHAGQVSFPGGRCEPHDRDAAATALREAHEEIALTPGRVEVVGQLARYQTVTGFLVTPVVGFFDPPLALSADPNEVAEIFELPLSVALKPENYERRSREFRGQNRPYYVLPHDDHYIWGATAAMLLQLANTLTG